MAGPTKVGSLRRLGPLVLIGGLGLGSLALQSTTRALGAAPDDERAAALLADMLRSVRQVVAQNQPLINNPDLGDKGLTGDVVLRQTLGAFREKTGIDPDALEPGSRDARLVSALEASIREVVDEQQHLINAKGVGFKAFIPAVMGRLVSQRFNEKEGGEAVIRVTAPIELVRNRQARPDPWETSVIEKRFKAADWPTGKPFAEETRQNGHEAFRVLAPEYYSAGCLSCHGEPKGEVDVTGYPKEGAKLAQLGGAISITLFR